MVERLKMDGQAAKHIQAYIEYDQIVGINDNGKMMSDKEFEKYKNQVRDARKKIDYMYTGVIKGQDCRVIGPVSQCFCGHRF